MKVTAASICKWAEKIEARSELPRLIRKLMNTAGKVTFFDVPAGDAVNQPGWDGELIGVSPTFVSKFTFYVLDIHCSFLALSFRVKSVGFLFRWHIF